MRGLRPPVWRLLWVASDTRLSDLNIVLQVAMGWSNLHLHRFEQDDRCYGIPDPYFPDDTRHESDYRLSELLGKSGDRITYRYDFGDDWMHMVRLEKVLPYSDMLPLPLCLRGRRACPLEDIGGPGGYKRFLAVLTDEGHPDHAAMAAWIGGEFDPENFDLTRTNMALEAYCQ